MHFIELYMFLFILRLLIFLPNICNELLILQQCALASSSKSAVFMPIALWRAAVGRRSRAPAEPQQLENHPPRRERWGLVVGRWLVVGGG